MSPYAPLRAGVPWGTGNSPEEPRGDTAPQQAPTYVCEKGHEFTVPFAAGVDPPLDWTHKCGADARLEGAPERIEEERDDHGISPPAQLAKRRTKAELEALLAERLAVVRQSGVAR